MSIERDGGKMSGKIRRRGHLSRYFPKPSFHIVAHSGERHYMAGNLDRSYCREVFSYMIFERIGLLAPETEYVTLSVNGIYQGLYISREPIDEMFFSRRGIAVSSLYQLRGNGRFTLRDGHNTAADFDRILPANFVNYDDLNQLINALDKDDTETITDMLDIDNAAKYSFVSSAINNGDGIRKNLHIGFFGRRGSKDHGRFRIIPFDLDLTFGLMADGGTAAYHGIPKYENGLLERAEAIYVDGNDRLRAIRYIMADIRSVGIAGGAIDSLRSLIRDAYKNDPYHRGENLDGYVDDLKRYISSLQ